MFGGRIRKTMYSDELCVFSVQDKQWTIYKNPRDTLVPWPHGRKLASLHYDKHTDCLYMFGGLLPQDMIPKLQAQGIQDYITSSDGDIRQTDLWKFDFDNKQWTCLSPKLPFCTIDEQHVLLQRSEDTLVVLGGQTMSHTLYQFSLDSATWHSVPLANQYGKPRPDRLRLFSTVCRQDEMILFGGKHCDAQRMTNDIWTFHIPTFEWRRIVTDSDSILPCKRDRTMVALLQNDFLRVVGRTMVT